MSKSYYAQKSRCLKMIETTIRKSPVKKETIYYFVMAEFGFGQKQCDEMIQLLIDSSIVEETKDGVLRNVL